MHRNIYLVIGKIKPPLLGIAIKDFDIDIFIDVNGNFSSVQTFTSREYALKEQLEIRKQCACVLSMDLGIDSKNISEYFTSIVISKNIEYELQEAKGEGRKQKGTFKL